MNDVARRWCATLVGLLTIGFACTPALAQQSKTVSGIVVNFGIVPAEVALRAEGHRDAHPPHPPAGSQHLLITLREEKGGKPIGDAEVLVEVTDPHGHVDRKPLLRTQAGGFPDYSELFEFRWSGDYSIRVIITPQPRAKPVETRFAVHHAV